MNKSFQINTSIIKLHTDNNNTIIIPYPLIESIGINLYDTKVVTIYNNFLQKYFFNNENYLPAIQAVLSGTIEQEKISVVLPKSEKFLRFTDMYYEYDLLYWKAYNGMYNGLVPGLWVEALGADLDELKSNIGVNLQIEFIRNQRYENIQNIIESNWFSKVETKVAPINVGIPSKEEIRKLQSIQEVSLTKKVLDRLRNLDTKIFGMDEELLELQSYIEEGFIKSIMVVGPSNSGKTSLIYTFLKQWKKKATKNKFFETSASKLIRGLTEETGWQSSLARLCNELQEKQGILYLGNWKEYFEIGQYIGNNISVGEAFKEYLQNHKVILVTESTEEELAVFEHRFPSYSSLFHQVHLKKKNNEEQKKIILDAVESIASKKEILIEPECIQEALLLHRRFFPYSGFPGKTIRFLESIILQNNENEIEITKDSVYKAFSQESGIPQFMVDPNLPLPEEQMKQFFFSKIFGQDGAVNSVIDILVTIKAGITSSHKPIASLLFAGPTGVGKTEMAKTISEFMFGESTKMIRLDMSEYSEYESILRITGDLGNSDSLVSKVRQSSFSVILFDEIEKAHYKFFDLLLQIMGEGRLTNVRGETANFCSCIIIITSNLGARESFQHSLGFESKDDHSLLKNRYIKVIENTFRPELINRLDEIVIFSELGKKQRHPIIQRELNFIQKRKGLLERKVVMDIPEQVIGSLTEKGHDVRYGARQMKRVLRKKVLIPLSMALNKYSATTKLNINFSLDPNSEVKVSSKGLTPDVAKTNATEKKQELINSITKVRRLFHSIIDSRIYLSLLSRYDRLEEEHSRNPKKFMKDAFQYNEYLELLKIQKRVKEFEDYIIKIELDSYIAYRMDEELPIQDNSKFSPSFWNLVLDLYMLQYGDVHYVIGIYGKKEVLYEICSKIYLPIFKHFEFEYEIYAVSLESDGQYTRSLISNWNDNVLQSNFIGIDFFLHGKAPSLLFTGESGVSEVEYQESQTEETSDKNKQFEKIYVSVFSGILKSYRIPMEVHREHFFKKLKTRRRYEKNRIFEYRYTETYKKEFSLGIASLEKREGDTWIELKYDHQSLISILENRKQVLLINKLLQ